MSVKQVLSEPNRDLWDGFPLDGTIAVAEMDDALPGDDDQERHAEPSAAEGADLEWGLPCDLISPPDLYLS
jgi:hypothetical protein